MNFQKALFVVGEAEVTTTISTDDITVVVGVNPDYSGQGRSRIVVFNSSGESATLALTMLEAQAVLTQLVCGSSPLNFAELYEITDPVMQQLQEPLRFIP